MTYGKTATAPPRPAATPSRPGRHLHWRGLTWPKLPAWLELATIGAGYAGYDLVRLAVRASRRAAFAHAAQMWRLEHALHVNIEPVLNRLVSQHVTLAEAARYYYGLLHFIVTPLVLAWLFLRRPAAFPRLRSALVLATAGANIVFWTWPLAPPRLAVPGMADVLVQHHILGSANPHGVTTLADLYAAMPSLHVAWAAWCAFAVVSTTHGRWRQLAWLYPAATTFVVLGSANHYVFDTIGGVVILALGLVAAGPAVLRQPVRPFLRPGIAAIKTQFLPVRHGAGPTRRDWPRRLGAAYLDMVQTYWPQVPRHPLDTHPAPHRAHPRT